MVKYIIESKMGKKCVIPSYERIPESHSPVDENMPYVIAISEVQEKKLLEKDGSKKKKTLRAILEL